MKCAHCRQLMASDEQLRTHLCDGVRAQLQEMAKLSPTQQRVVDQLRTGWKLKRADSLSGRVYMQPPNTGRVDQSRVVSVATWDALRKKRVIAPAGAKAFPMQEYQLTPAWRADSPSKGTR